MIEQNLSSLLSESIEMYLIRIALLSGDEKPVPISHLAEELAISPVSTNQMCRKLEERGLVAYQPYKGVLLTPAGIAIAQRVLRKRRLWEVFLVEKLGLPPQTAEDFACRFEHVTTDDVGEKLSDYLGNPTVSPQSERIPPAVTIKHPIILQSLSDMQVGQRAQIVEVGATEPAKEFLEMEGIQPGAHIRVLAVSAQGALLVEVADNELILASDIAATVQVTLTD
ncbi:MAG: metal-dependent transcriptional regulator [Chloroflexi bacterium]|nr:metal-dependent transcriptional regulator [Chloroflexota bacterium]